jgi:hypothetical protein
MTGKEMTMVKAEGGRSNEGRSQCARDRWRLGTSEYERLVRDAEESIAGAQAGAVIDIARGDGEEASSPNAVGTVEESITRVSRRCCILHCRETAKADAD